MKPIQARAILQSLTLGVDPETGADLPKNAITLRSEILRALYAGIAALDAVQKRAQRRAQLPSKVGVPWTLEEEQDLIREFRSGATTGSIAEAHARTVRAIEARLERMGLITAEQRTTRRDVLHSTPPKKS